MDTDLKKQINVSCDIVTW